MAKVVPIAKALPNEKVIKAAEQILELAKAGHLRSLIWCGEDRGGYGMGWVTGHTDRVALLGMLSRMQNKLNTLIDQTSESEPFDGP